jgi:hypothetical protein
MKTHSVAFAGDKPWNTHVLVDGEEWPVREATIRVRARETNVAELTMSVLANVALDAVIEWTVAVALPGRDGPVHVKASRPTSLPDALRALADEVELYRSENVHEAVGSAAFDKIMEKPDGS